MNGQGTPFILQPEGNNALRWSPGERLHYLFDKRCDRFQELGNIHHPAIKGAEGVFSYGELDRCANQLARCLLREGLGSGAVVVLLFDKSIYCYMSLLAVLKINAPYLPLDPGFPADRIGYIVNDSGVSSILTLSSDHKRLRHLAPPVICLELVQPKIEMERDERLGLNGGGNNLVDEDLWPFLAKAKVSAFCCVPTLPATIENDVPDLHLLIVLGKACPIALAKRWHGSGRTILNTCGPVETTVTATLAVLHPDEPVIIGTPIYNVYLRALGARVSASNFFGNNIYAPAGIQVGDNCLRATKAMTPIDGPLREDTGLLGSSCLAIPGSPRRDQRFDAYKEPDVLKDRLERKNASIALTLLLFLASIWAFLSMVALVAHFVLYDLALFSPLGFTLSLMAVLTMSLVYVIIVERAVLGFERLQREFCSIDDDHYWYHERYWKLSFQELFAPLNGTPVERSPCMKTLALRGPGARIRKKVFDDGCFFPESTPVTIGDYCTLNEASMVQCHSLEDGTFKSDHTVIGSGCTIGVNAFVHYGVVMATDSALAPDLFPMKGERPTGNSLWSGNPAKKAQVEEQLPDQLQVSSAQSLAAAPAAGRERGPALDPLAARST